MIKLTDEKKRLLFKERYVTARTLDALVTPNWEDYFIKKFDWKLSETRDNYGFYELKLVEKKAFCGYKSEYDVRLNLDCPQGLRLSDLRD